MLLEHVLARPRAWLLAHDTDPLEDAAVQAFHALVQRRLAGEPMAYLVATREFMGHAFRVGPDVLIPRPDTEVLVETAIACLQAGGPAPRVLDMGTGSGAIAISLALAVPRAQVWALDNSPAALAVAQDNARRLQADVRFIESDWFAALPASARFDLIVSNPPYIAVDDPHLQTGDVRFEPRQALTDGSDGLSAIRILAGQASRVLSAAGQLWIEHGWQQAAAVRGLLVAAGFAQVQSRHDLSGIERITGGELPGRATSL